MKTLLLCLLVTHVSCGFTALMTGLMPMLWPKGSPVHRRAGRIYVYCIMVVVITALLLCVLQPFKLLRLFLVGIAVLNFYLCWTGWRTTRRKRSSPERVDWQLTYLTLTISVAMLAMGLYLLLTQPSVFAILFTIFGFLTFKNAWYDVGLFRQLPEKKHWFYHHITRMSGSYIGTFTAFLVNNLNRMLPKGSPAWVDLLGWLAPTLIGSLLIAYTVRSYKQKFKRELPAPAPIVN